jgi:SAM-dependent methyltransferase
MADPAVITEAVELLMHDPALAKRIRVLEAGCGSTSDVRLPFEKEIVGIDIDADQLKHNDRIDAKILGDLQTYELPPNEFDLVACVDVLEHLPFPEKAFVNMGKTVKPGGYLLIAGPEPYSYKGLIAKYTPHSMRFFIHRLITGTDPRETRRIHGNGQIFIPTHMKRVCSLKNLVAIGKRFGLSVVFERAFNAHSRGLRAAYKPFLGPINFLTRCVELVTAGRINLLLADYVVLFKKVEHPTVQN